MSKKEDILKKYRANVREQFPMPDLSDIQAVTYTDPLRQFIEMTQSVGGRVVEFPSSKELPAFTNEVPSSGDEGSGVVAKGLGSFIRSLYPEAREIASNLPEVADIATRNPDTVASPQDLNGTDVGIIRGAFGVAENGCIWVPQHMVQKAVCFISENLVILLPKSQIVNNMHEAYHRLRTDARAFSPSFGSKVGSGAYGTFISGPSKTADIAQVLVMGAQAARTVTVVLLPE